MFKVSMEWRGIALGCLTMSTDDLDAAYENARNSGVTYTIIAYWPAGF